MVTTAEARTQLQAQRQALQQRQQQIRATALRKLTREEIGRQTRQSIIQRKQQVGQLETQKRQALKALKPVEEQLVTTEREIKRVEDINVARAATLSAWKTAKAHFEKKISPYWLEAGQVKSFLEQMWKERRVAKLTAPVAPKEVETLTAYKNILTGEMIYQSILPGKVPAYYQPVQVSPVTLKEVGLSPKEQLMASLGVHPVFVPPPIEPVGVVEDIEKPPSVVSLPPTPLEEIRFRISKILTTAETRGREFTEKVATLMTIPASAAEEQRVESIKLPSIPGATQITRPIDFRDVDTGVLPPMQNLELKSTKILTDYSLGKIPEAKALEGLEKAQKRYIWEESKRTAALRFIEGAGIGALTVLAPPIGYTLIGISGADAIARRREIIAFAKVNPGAAAIQFTAGVAGGLVGAGGISAIKAKSIKFREPTIKLTGKARVKFWKEVLKRFEPDQRIELAKLKQTATRTFTIDIPSPKNKVTLKIVEFTKNGAKRFAGLEYIDGKPSSAIGGFSFVKGRGGDAKIITRSIRTHTKKGLTNLEVSEYLERVSTKAVKSEGLRSITLTENEVKLAKMFELKGLTPAQIREILRRPMFGVKEAQRRSSVPFTDYEFKTASKMAKSKFITSRDIVKARLTNLNKQLGPLIAERDIVDIRVVERGVGSVDIVFNLPKPVFKIKPKIGRVRVPGKVRGIGIVVKKIRKADMPRMPHRTPLSRTFAEETSQILRQRISSGKKIRLLQKLKEDVSPIGAFRSIAKKIQQERINLAIKQAGGKAAVVGVITGIKVTPKTVALAKQKQLLLVKSLSRQKDGASIAQVSPTIVKEAEKMALAGKITQVQLQTLKSKLILKQRLITPLARVPRVSPPVIPVVPIIKIPKGVSRTKTVKALAALGKQGVDIITGLKERKKRILRKNLPAFKALKFGRGYVDRNIEASYKLVPSGKKAKGKDIKPFNVGVKFRPSKVNPLFLVEKRKFRLDHPQERRQIKLLRQAKKRKPIKRKVIRRKKK